MSRRCVSDLAQQRLDAVTAEYEARGLPKVKPLPEDGALSFTVMAEDGRARNAVMVLPHGPVETPAFMPVGTQGTIKGLRTDEVAAQGPTLILGNTYHLGNRPGREKMREEGGLHKFMGWGGNLLTDSGGFQMVSLIELSTMTEEGVKFNHPETGEEMLLTPEESMGIQNDIGSDIMMALDDVVSSQNPSHERLDEAEARTLRWMKRCIAAHKNVRDQALFAITQGGVFPDLRIRSIDNLLPLNCPGYAIGGLSGGESKQKFWPIVEMTAPRLPSDKPRYLMGVGDPLDIVVCVAMGVDLFDCVYPTRTARFGTALTDRGVVRLHRTELRDSIDKIDASCDCSTCDRFTIGELRELRKDPLVGQLLTIHNLRYMDRLGHRIREAIRHGRMAEFVVNFIEAQFPVVRRICPPTWVRDALKAIDIDLDMYDWLNWENVDEKDATKLEVAHDQYRKRLASKKQPDAPPPPKKAG